MALVTNPGLVSNQSQGKEYAVMNPFEDPDGRYSVLINDEGQHSLWPIFAEVPGGWTVIFGEDGRQECLDFIEKSWTDMRPNSLIEAMEMAKSSSS
jgi:MbtH protein